MADGLVRAVDGPLTPPDSVAYDAQGNLSAVRSPLGFWSLTYRDGLGRDTLSITPIDSASTTSPATLGVAGARQRTVYDAAGRVTLQQSIGPAAIYAAPLTGRAVPVPAETASVRNVYLNGLLRQTDRWSSPDLAAIGVVSTAWRYDAASRKVAEVAPDGQVDSTTYDPAGNVVSARNRLGETVTMEYDALGRLQRRMVPRVSRPYETVSPLRSYNPGYTWRFPRFRDNGTGALDDTTAASSFFVPGDTSSFTYDALGNLRSATNHDASVSRTYFPNGALKTETQRVRTYVGEDTVSHAYTLTYAYDLEGRRTSLAVPSAVAAGPGAQQYGYNAATGELRRVTDVLGNPYDYVYDVEGRLSTFTRNGIVESYDYDADGRPGSRLERHISTNAQLHGDAMRYDARGKLLSVTTPEGEYTSFYTGLGALRSSYRTFNSTTVTEERYANDALGNRYSSRQAATPVGQGGAPTGFRYIAAPDTSAWNFQAATGRSNTRRGAAYTDTSAFDAAGNQRMRLSVSVVSTPYSVTCPSSHFLGFDMRCEQSGVDGVLVEVTKDWFGADGKLRISDHRTCLVFDDSAGASQCDSERLPLGNQRSAFEEYRYDALGRRVLVRSRQAVFCGLNCQNLVRRTIWDGDQVLAEIQAPGETGILPVRMETDAGANLHVATGSLVVAPDLLDATEFAATDTVPQAQTYLGFHFGRVLYTHGPGIDAPLSLIRMDYSDSLSTPQLVVLHNDWRGEYDLGSYAGGTLSKPCRRITRSSTFQTVTSDGQISDNHKFSGPTNTSWYHCIEVEWPAPHVWVTRETRERSINGPNAWMGTLIDGMRDNSGHMYMRNRYYDPTTGRFTQEDPIGLAGGLNAYGFAAGDPVTYSDPYGLCPNCRSELSSRYTEEEVRFQQNLTPRDRVVLSGAALGAALGGLGVMRLTTSLMLRVAPAAPAAASVAERLVRPPTPGGMSLAQFGQQVMQWGRGNETARERIGELTREGLEQAGVTRDMALQWTGFYVNEIARNPNNPSAAGRADLMKYAADLLK